MQVPWSESQALVIVFLDLPSVFDSFASLVPFSLTSFPRNENLNLSLDVGFVSNAHIYNMYGDYAKNRVYLIITDINVYEQLYTLYSSLIQADRWKSKLLLLIHCN